MVADLNRENPPFPPSQHQCLLPANGYEALLFTLCEVEALCHRRCTGCILCFEDFDGCVGGHNAAPGILHKLFRTLCHGHDAQVAFACPARECGQEVPPCGMLDE